ncbi:ABC transporter permease [Sedimentibacter hydroxybenzoicus DSM 7310]|uniref:ABC transporter permease n=1 Tax=Sedimentibacter hydroxybenzoicus DSM 7310 TaxID=1123245 RepID=A0A974BIB6_SEDHY|nr:ABC transporter permease [Sedimentibacter hydroxybenzoicus]NYB73739.1 ABC transporter permease [Sedimentibacter hydroxybenzoicus DSM 7310]
MKSFFRLIGFEYKKIFKKRSNIVILLIAVFLTAFSSLGPLMGNYYIKGEIFESNYEGMKRDREYIRSLSDREVGSDILSEAIGAYSLIPPTDGKYTDTDEYQRYARPYSEINYIIRKSYGMNDWKEVKSLTGKDVKSFYDVRQGAVERSIEETTMSPAEKSASVSLSRQVKTPFAYSYTGGYTRFFSQMYTTAILICFICSICIAPLFSGEYTDKTDSLILSSKYGKNKVIHAKLITGISFSVLLTIMLTIVSYVTVMMFFGREGGEAPIQIFLPLSIHPFTIVQAALLYFTIVLMGNLLSAAIVMLLSARLKSPFMVMVIMTVITVSPMFINISENTLWIYHLFNLIPVNMFYLSRILDKFSIDLFGLIVQPYEVTVIFSVALGIILMPLAYSGFKKHN